MGRVLENPRSQILRERVLARYVAGLPDRRYWNAAIMPTLLNAGFKRILFVGCGSYTRHVHEEFESAGCECWTADIVPGNAQWGNPRRHLVCDVADIRRHVPSAHFDAVLFNGVMGYGVTGAHMDRIAPVLADILRAGGLLLIGWNRGRVEDPLTLPAVTRLFRTGGGGAGLCRRGRISPEVPTSSTRFGAPAIPSPKRQSRHSQTPAIHPAVERPRACLIGLFA